MAKICSICGRKMGFLDGKIIVSDGTVCASCWTSAGLDLSMPSIKTALKRTTWQLRDMIEIELLKGEAVRTGLRPRELPKSSSDIVYHNDNGISNPINIVFSVDKDKKVEFRCEGRPIINFDDLINGREMIIGDGYFSNYSETTLPEVRIVCGFEPEIINSGLIYYEEGTFTSGLNDKFEIDDPPINLEEYSKIKTHINGKIRFTLFIGEQEIHTEECEMIVEPAPAEEMNLLMRAVIYEEEKNSPGPVNVFLYARDWDTYEIDLMRKPELLYSMYSNGKEQLIGDVFINNETNHTLKNIKFEAKFTSDILSSMKVLLGDVGPGERTSFEVDDPAIDMKKLEMLTEIETCIATYRILVNGRTVAETTGKITICPYNQWNAALILLPAYMTPNHPNIINVLQNASQWMLINGMNPSLEGYQSDAARVDEMVGAVYNAVKEANIIYSNPPASFFGPQRIRLCETVFQQKFATCMDMTILFASCLESFGLHPVLITSPGHIFAGVWMDERGRLEEPIISDAKLIQEKIRTGKLIAVECTAMNAGADIDYETAKKIANKTINSIVKENIEDHECIDVQIARAIGVRPLPIRVQSSVADIKRPVPANNTVKKTLNEEKKDSVNVERSIYKKVDYVEYSDNLSHISLDNFYDKDSKRILKDAIEEIVDKEGPISQPALIKALINSTSLGRTGKQINEYIDKLVATANVKITRQNGIRFLWNRSEEPAAYSLYRIKNQRNPDDICKYELKNAICLLIQENGPMSRDEIMKAMVQLLGYSRSSKKIEDGVLYSIKVAKELKCIEQDENKKYMLKS